LTKRWFNSYGRSRTAQTGGVELKRIFRRLGLVLGIALIIVAALTTVSSLLRSRVKSHGETPWVSGLKSIFAGQADYFALSEPHTYSAGLANLASGNGAGGVGFIDPSLASGVRDGYTFTLFPGPSNANGQILTWSATAWPLKYGPTSVWSSSTGTMSWFIDHTGVLRGSDVGGKPGTKDMPAME
jgi:hypothetical protein